MGKSGYVESVVKIVVDKQITGNELVIIFTSTAWTFNLFIDISP